MEAAIAVAFTIAVGAVLWNLPRMARAIVQPLDSDAIAPTLLVSVLAATAAVIAESSDSSASMPVFIAAAVWVSARAQPEAIRALLPLAVLVTWRRKRSKH